MLALVFGSVPTMASAAPGDDAEALGSFLNADLLPIDAADLATAYASFPGGPAVDAEPFNLQALETLGLDVELVGGGALRVPLIGSPGGSGLLNLGELGAVNGYAATASPISSIAASGAVSDDGTIAISTDADPADLGTATIDLTDLLDQLGVAEVTDALIDEAALEVGALASRATDLPGEGPASDYRVTDLGIELHSPAVEALADSLRGTLDLAATDLTDDLTALAGPEGDVAAVVDAIADVELLGVASASLGDATVSVTPPDLSALVDGVLGGPDAIVVSDDGAVTIDLTDGSISVDLAALVNPDGPNLNGLDANTRVLTDDTIALITAGVTNALGKVAGLVTAGLDAAIASTAITLEVDLDVTALPGLGGVALVDAPIVISGSLADFAAGSATVDTSELALLPGAPVCLGAVVLGACVGVDVNDVLAAVLESVVDTTVPAILAGVAGPLADAGTASAGEITGTLDTLVADVLGLLTPAVEGLLANVATVTINEQPAVGDLGPDSFTVRALAVTLLPNVAGSNLVTLNLASSTVTALAALPGPMLTGIEPGEGPTTGGTEVTLTGTDLGDVTGVTVDGEPVDFTPVSVTEIAFETPAHAPGEVDVVVTSPAGDSNALPFVYLPAPTITALTPDEGPATGGTEVTITGTDLGGATDVTIDGAPVAFTQVSDTEVTFVTPPHAAGPVDVTIETVGGVSDPLEFTYLPAPVLLDVDPAAGPVTGGTEVTLTGEELGGATEVTVDGVPVEFDQVSDTEIVFETPAHAPGTVDVIVTTGGGTTNPLPFEYVAAPVLTDLDPDAGPVTGGTEVTIGGTDLGEVTEVTVGGEPVPFTPVSDTEIVFETPPGTEGTVDVVVTTPGGTSNPLPFDYVAAPVVISIVPGFGPTAGGTTVTITGNDLHGATDVRIDDISVPFTEGPAVTDDVVVLADGETLTFVTPPHAEGPVDVVVETPGGVSDPAVFVYVPEPELLVLAPDEGPASGGTEVTVTGTDLAGAAAVTVDGTDVPFTQVSATEVEFVTPPHAAGTVDVTVTTAGGESEPLPFTYLPAPVLLDLAPDRGPETGGTEVTITGELLADASDVTVDGIDVEFTQVDDETITFVTPAHAPGEVDVVVTTPTAATNALPFTYEAAAAAGPLALAPASGPASGGTTVTITGTGLAATTEVAIDGVAVPFTVVNDATITFVTPPHAVGTVPVTVTAGGSTSAPLAFAYTAATIDDVAPPSGPATGGTEVTLVGQCFTGATAVWFGETAATSFRVVDDRTIVAVAPAGTGVVDIRVAGAGACGQAVATDGYTYVAAAAGGSTAGGLASTGVDLLLPVIAGLLILLAGGACLLVAMRRRSRRS